MVNKIRVDTENLARWASKLTEVSEALTDAADALSDVDTSEGWWRKVKMSDSIKLRDEGGSVSLTSARTAVSRLESTLKRYYERVDKLSAAVKKAGLNFADVEEDVRNLVNGAAQAVNMQTYAEASAQGKNILADWANKLKNVDWVDKIADFFGDSGMLLEASAGYAKWLENISRISRAVPDLANKGNLWDFLTRDVYKFYGSKASTFSNFGSRFYNNFHKIPSLKENFTSGGASSAVAWGGAALSAFGNAISNYSEWKSGDISGGRAAMETVTETAVDVSTGWLIGAGVTAGVATIFGGAPVIVVAAGTLVVTKTLDWATEKITGHFMGEEKDFSELVSDFALDAGEAVISGGKKVFSAAGDFIKNGWSDLTNGMSTAFGW